MGKLCVVVMLAMAGVASAQPSGGPPSNTLERAIKLYDKKDFFSASIELGKVIQGESGDDTVNVQRGRFFMGKTLLNMDFSIPALAFFASIFEKPDDAYHEASLKWIAAVFAIVPSSGARGVLHALTPKELEAPSIDAKTRETLSYAAGRNAVDANAEEPAKAFLDAVPASSQWYARAQLALARIELRRYKIPEGTAAAKLAAKDPEVAADAVHELAFWAQMFGHAASQSHDPEEVRRLDAVRDSLVQLAGSAPSAAFESSRFAVALAARFPHLQDVSVAGLDAVAISTACIQGATPDGREHLLATARELGPIIDKILKDDDNAEIYEAVERMRREAADRPALAAVRLILADREILEDMAWLTQLKVQLDLVQKSDRAWQTTQIASEIVQELTLQQSIATVNVGRRYHDRLDQLRRELALIQGAFGGVTQPLPIGPKVAVGTGFIVPDALCRTAMGSAPATLATPTGPANTNAPVPQAHGCAGCGAGGDAGFPIVVVFGFMVSRRRDREHRSR